MATRAQESPAPFKCKKQKAGGSSAEDAISRRSTERPPAGGAGGQRAGTKARGKLRRAPSRRPRWSPICSRPVLRAALPFLAEALRGGGRVLVLVHCSRGESRSASVAAAYLMQARGLALQDARRTPPCAPTPASWRSSSAGTRTRMPRVCASPGRRSKANGGTATTTAPAAAAEPSAQALSAWARERCSDPADCELPERESLALPDMGAWLLVPHGEAAAAAAARRAVAVVGGIEGAVLVQGVLSRQVQGVPARDRGNGAPRLRRRTSFPQSYRGNRRLQLDDASGTFARRLWSSLGARAGARAGAPVRRLAGGGGG